MRFGKRVTNTCKLTTVYELYMTIPNPILLQWKGY